MRTKGQGLRVLKTKLSEYMGSPCLSQQGTVVTSSSLPLSVCDSRGLRAAEVSAGHQRGDCVSALPACMTCKRSLHWQEQPSPFIFR